MDLNDTEITHYIVGKGLQHHQQQLVSHPVRGKVEVRTFMLLENCTGTGRIIGS